MVNLIRNSAYKQVVIATPSNVGVEILKNALEGDFNVRLVGTIHEVNDILNDSKPDDIHKPLATIFIAKINLKNTFIYGDILFLKDSDIIGDRAKLKHRTKSLSVRKIINLVKEFEIGKPVVHKTEGIGMFVGLEVITVFEVTQEFFVIEYQKQDRLYLPVQDLHLVSRYDGEVPQIDKLGSNSWQLRKDRLKKDLMIIADSIIQAAAKRKLKPAKVFTNNEIYEDFCDKFLYTETPDQMQAIVDVEQDMELGVPMDRLICGDVGFGKTEVAMRASCLVASSRFITGKPAQVLMIVPTTLLARQHHITFAQRFSGTGLRVASISRLVDAKKAALIKEEFSRGEIDILVGTHALFNNKLLSNKIELVIIDEEQHFGVEQKEIIKLFKHNVHLLTMSATPIPRTLHMSMNSIKSISIIATPPLDRMKSINTYAMPFDALTIKDAIMREKARSGTVFYVCAKVKDLEEQEIFLRELLPQLNIIKLHGGMSRTTLELGMQGFCDGKFDLLLSTAIVESGLDIPDANTIIIYNAHLFGLAQLHQLRGRVGRRDRQGYAYLFYNALKLPKHAKERLEVMQNYGNIGDGFAVASSDFDIRGGGNVVGKQQTGHIKGIGYELYYDMLSQALASLNEGRDISDIEEKGLRCRLNISESIYIPEGYIPDFSIRMEIYTSLADAVDEFEVEELVQEYQARFGEAPESVQNLFEITKLSIRMSKLFVEKVDASASRINLIFSKNLPNPEILLRYINQNAGKVKLNADSSVTFFSGDSKIKTMNRLRTIASVLEGVLGN